MLFPGKPDISASVASTSVDSLYDFLISQPTDSVLLETLSVSDLTPLRPKLISRLTFSTCDMPHLPISYEGPVCTVSDRSVAADVTLSRAHGSRIWPRCRMRPQGTGARHLSGRACTHSRQKPGWCRRAAAPTRRC